MIKHIVKYLNKKYEILIDDENEYILKYPIYLQKNDKGLINFSLMIDGKLKGLCNFLSGKKRTEFLNGNRLDFRKENLVERTKYYNGVVGKSGHKSISIKKNGKYKVSIYVPVKDYPPQKNKGRPKCSEYRKKSKGRNLNLGVFNTLEEAIKKRDDFNRKRLTNQND